VLSRVPVATGRIGSASIPAVGELVLVQFLNGDVNSPVIVGRLYNDEDRPPPNDDGQAILHVPLGASDDQAVHIEVHSDTRKVVVKLGSGLDLTVQDDDPVVKLDVGDNASITVGKDGRQDQEPAASRSRPTARSNRVASHAQGLQGQHQLEARWTAGSRREIRSSRPTPHRHDPVARGPVPTPLPNLFPGSSTARSLQRQHRGQAGCGEGPTARTPAHIPPDVRFSDPG
jgi:uncharacterized protein involved in type VI secretion and phage assembly